MSTLLWKWKAVPAEGSENLERADVAILRALEENLGEWDNDDEPPTLPSRSQLKRLIEEGQLTAGGGALKANAKLKPGTEVELRVPPPRPLEVRSEDAPIDILYEDEHLLVLNKPPGLTVHPSDTQADGTLVNRLLHHIRDLSGISGVLRPGIVHRIDKNTSGALVITKSDAAHTKLVETFSRHAIERAYWALCYGSPKEGSTERKIRIEGAIGRSPNDRKKMALVPESAGGRRAVSFFRHVEHYAQPKAKPFASWLEVTLETGRTHQVRVHLTNLGHSLLGDPVYGVPSERHPKWLALPPEVREAVEQMPGQALHARVLGFEHPITGKPLRFEAEPPQGFSALLGNLQRYR